jgi:penicillin-binding protein 1B
VVELDDASSRKSLDIVRLEAPSIGSIYPAHREDRILVRRSEIPDHLVAALLAVEDRRFYEHWGIDPRGLARAMFNNLRAGRVVQGGSTLTQQLVKNFLLSSERSITRKVNEALMAFIVESRYSKDEILEAYANEIFLGQDRERSIHGFGLAAQFYFNRPLH